EELHQCRIELGASALASDRYRRRHPSRPVKDLDDVREIDEPRGQVDLVAPDLGGHAASVPALERLVQALANLSVKAEPSRELVGCEPVILDHVLDRTPPISEKGDAEPGTLHQRPTAPKVFHHECSGGEGAAYVDLTGVVLECRVVSEPLGLLVRVNMTSDPGEQAHVVYNLSLAVIETQPLCKAQRTQ